MKRSCSDGLVHVVESCTVEDVQHTYAAWSPWCDEHILYTTEDSKFVPWTTLTTCIMCMADESYNEAWGSGQPFDASASPA